MFSRTSLKSIAAKLTSSSTPLLNLVTNSLKHYELTRLNYPTGIKSVHITVRANILPARYICLMPQKASQPSLVLDN
jgi:hypothetical protein